MYGDPHGPGFWKRVYSGDLSRLCFGNPFLSSAEKTFCLKICPYYLCYCVVICFSFFHHLFWGNLIGPTSVWTIKFLPMYDTHGRQFRFFRRLWWQLWRSEPLLFCSGIRFIFCQWYSYHPNIACKVFFICNLWLPTNIKMCLS